MKTLKGEVKKFMEMSLAGSKEPIVEGDKIYIYKVLPETLVLFAEHISQATRDAIVPGDILPDDLSWNECRKQINSNYSKFIGEEKE